MRYRKNLFLLLVLLVGAVWGCKNNSSTSPDSAHPVDLAVGQFGSGFDDLNSPIGLCVDGSNNLYVADYGNNRIKQYNSSGTCLAIWGGPVTVETVAATLDGPWGLATDLGGNVLEVDKEGVKVQQFSTAGALITKWGSGGTANGSFTDPFWVAVNPTNGAIAISDTDNDRVQVFTSPNVFGSVLGSGCACSILGKYYSTTMGVAYDAAGNAYVGDLGNRRIEVFNSAGAPVSTWGAGDFTGIAGLAFDRSGNLLAVDQGAKTILKFNSTGGLIETWTPGFLARPEDAVVDSTGAIWVSFQDSADAFIVKYAR
jgi:hypothetical protein